MDTHQYAYHPSAYITKDVMATKGQRFANFIIDSLVKYAISMSFVFVAVFLARYLGYDSVYSWFEEENTFMDLLYSYLLSAAYYIVLEGITQRSIAKYMTGTKVLMEDGSVPPFGTILKRTLCRFIPVEPFSFLGDDLRGWHDTISKTVVVDIKKYEEALSLKNSFDEIGTAAE